MVKKLAAAELVSHVPYGAITLTPVGEQRAVAMVRRHRLIETWLVETYGYGWHEVHDEAEVLEHALSDRLLAAIDDQLGSPRVDPHGDVIPDADGNVEREAFVLLAEAPAGHTGRVLRVSDRDPDLLCALDDLGVRVGTSITVTASGAHVAESNAALPDDAGHAVWLSRTA